MIRQTLSPPAPEADAPVSLTELSRRMRAGRSAEFVPLALGLPRGRQGFEPLSLVRRPPEPPPRGELPAELALTLPEPAAEAAEPAPFAPGLLEAIEAARAEGFREGLHEGLTQGEALGLAEGQTQGREEGQREARARAEAELSHARRLFETAAARLSVPDAGDVSTLSAALSAAVARLASERAGLAIDSHPEAFARRIAALADRIGQGLRDVTIHLNPEDLAVLSGHLTASALLGQTPLLPDPALARGDAEVRAEGVTLSDVLSSVTPEDAP